MTGIPFCKFHGFGNDYIVIEKDKIGAETDVSELAMAICHRHTGVGGDGIAVLEKLEDEPADYFCEIVNPDGSIAGFSGNGTRCASAYLYYKALWRGPGIRLETRSGIKNFTLIEREADGLFWFEAEIGKPMFASGDIPATTAEQMDSVIDQPVTADGKEFLVSCVNVGNPVACSFVEDFDPKWRKYGEILETHPFFPERANIVFVKVLDNENIELRIWERGAGETPASGTCATGAAILCARTGRTGRAVSVLTEGGTTEIFWRKDDEMLITGRADLAFCGEWPS